MSQAQVICLENARSHQLQAKVHKDYLDYLKMLTNEEIDNEVKFFIEHQTVKISENPALASRGYSLMSELARRIDCEYMKASVTKMAEELKSRMSV